MTKNEIFKNNISWLAKEKEIRERIEDIKSNLEFYENGGCRSIAASNIALYGGELRRLSRELDTLEDVLISEFRYVNRDVEIELN